MVGGTLDRKLLRDLWRMKLQAIAIASVVAMGVLLLVMMDGLVNSLDQTRQAYYDRYRLADVFAPVKRAPEATLDRLRGLDGVAVAEGRVTGLALVDLPGQALPIRAQAVSLPESGPPRLNDVYLSAGRRPAFGRDSEILLLEGFAHAQGLAPGDTLSATLNGLRRTFRIVGLAQSPEFVYAAPPGEIVPDDTRFGVIWMNQTALAAAYDLEGAFNEALIALDRNARAEAVLAALDRELARYGAVGAYGLEDQRSNRFVTEEIGGLRVSARAVPPVFMAVAAFLLYIVVSRMIEAERVQIGLLKAFGYTSREVGQHYFKLVLTIAAGGALVGCALGMLSGQAMAELYQRYYKFPFLLFRVDPAAFITALTVSVAAASAGGLLVLRKVFALTPAVAMRPPAPVDYAGSARLVAALKPVLDAPSRMVVRRIARQPARTGAAILGIATGMGLSVAMLGVLGGFNRTLDLTFTLVDRSDAQVVFAEPMGPQSLSELRSLPGVIDAEPVRDVPAILRHGVRSHRGALTGLEDTPRLYRALDADLVAMSMRSDGVILSAPLAEKLGARPGDLIQVDVREGRRPTLTLPVAAVSDTLLGAPAYFERAALNRALGEPGRLSGAYLRLDPRDETEVFRELKARPAVAGVTLKADARNAMQRMMDEGAGAMRYVMMAIAATITFGIVYNAARIAFAERAHDLASLRVMGFTRGETAFVLLGELGVIVALALPLGILIGLGLSDAIAAGFSTDLYTVPAQLGPASVGLGSVAVLFAALVSGLLVKRDIDRLDLVSALKSRE